MLNSIYYYDFVPKLVPQKMSGTIKTKIWQKKDKPRQDGNCPLYLDIYQMLEGKPQRKRLNLNIAVPMGYFDEKKQRVKTKHKYFKDYNLVIEKMLADVNTIQVNYRLNNEFLTIKKLVDDLTNPSLRISFYRFWDELMEYQHNKKIIQYETYKQQRATLRKIKEFKKDLLFKDINEKYLLELRAWLKNYKKQAPATIEIVFKNIKKYLHAANEKGIRTPITYNKIQVKKTQSNFTFLIPSEVKTLYNFYNSDQINEDWRNILQRYLFSCFTGLRISDIKRLKEDNFIDDNLVFISHKSQKLQRIKLNKTAVSLVLLPHVFNGEYAEVTINRELKLIAHACGITKRLYYHSSRHTFATNYLIAGGQIQNLQKVLGHSKIETTMVYTHVVDSLMNNEIGFLDDIVS